MKKGDDKPLFGIKLERRDQILYARIKPSTLEFLKAQAAKSGARTIGEYIDSLVETLKGAPKPG